MMRWNRFSASLLFAAFAALALPFAVSLLAPALGSTRAIALLWICLGGLHAMGGVTGRSRIVGGLLVWLFALGLTPLLPGSPIIGIEVTSLLLALTRAGSSVRAWTMRRIAAEIVIACASLAWVQIFLAPRPLAIAVAAWGYFLIQSAYPLCQEWVQDASRPRGVDPFDRARSRLLSLLEE